MRALALYNTYSTRVVATLAAVIALAAFCYGFFLLEAVAHAASQASAHREVAKLSGQVAQVQSHYLTYTQGLTPERAVALGFVAPKQVAVMYANPTQGLSINANH